MSGCAVEYPAEVPVACVREVIRIVRGSRVWEERSSLAAHLWNIQGYLQRVAIGTPAEEFKVLEMSGESEAILEGLEALVGGDPSLAERPLTERPKRVPVALLLRWALNTLVELLLTKE